MWPIDQRYISNGLNDGCVLDRLGDCFGALARPIGRRLADANLDQLTIREGLLDGIDERLGYTFLSDVREGLQFVAETAQVGALFGGEGSGHRQSGFG